MSDLTPVIKAELIRQGGYAYSYPVEERVMIRPGVREPQRYVDAVVMGDDSDARYVDIAALAKAVEGIAEWLLAEERYWHDQTMAKWDRTADRLDGHMAAAAHLQPVITTEGELWDLPEGTVIRTEGKYGDVLERDGNSWYSPGDEVGDILPKLPAVVLWRPSEA